MNGDINGGARQRVRERIRSIVTGGNRIENDGISEGDNSGGYPDASMGLSAIDAERFERSGGEPEPTIIEIGGNGVKDGDLEDRKTGANRRGTSRRNERAVESGNTGKKTGRKGAKAAQDALGVEEDRGDIRALVVGIFDSAANLTHFDGFACSESEADTIARPASRIMNRHGFGEAVRRVSDPIALLLATITVAGPRIAAYKLYQSAGAVQTPSAPARQAANGTISPNPQGIGAMNNLFGSAPN